MMKKEAGQYLEGAEKRYPQGIIFDVKGEEALLLALFDNPYPQEVADYRKGGIKLKVVAVNDIIFFISKLGDSPWMESPFNVHFVHDYNLPDNKSIGLNILLVDATNGLVKASRWVSLDLKFSRELTKMIKHQQGVSLLNYDALLNEVSSMLKTADLITLDGIESNYPGA